MVLSVYANSSALSSPLPINNYLRGDPAPGAPTDYVAGGAGSAAPWWGLFMAVPGSLTFFRVLVVNPFAAEAPGLEVLAGVK